LTQHPRYFNIKVERAKTYFPIIDKIFEEERLPLDFKYLVLQESALIADAVSVSNAVGFWQFKDFTAMEMGLRVDKEVDERMNIHSATRAAARYLKKNNFMFNNWLLALQSYQMGGGGVQRSVGDKYNGARHMDITSDTYWYIKKYLAHKVAFENAVKGEAQVKVSHYPITSAKSFSELSNELAMEESVLRDYNKWIRKDKIPADKTYVVVIPTGKLPSEFNTLNIASSSKPEVIEVKPTARTEKKRHNGILAIQAMPGETTTSLAKRAGVGISEFLKFNEIPIDHTVMVGSHYYLARKKIRSSGESYTVRSGDDWWLVSQQTGVQLKRLKKYNKQLTASLKAGDVVRLDNVKQPITTTTNTAPVLEPIAEETIVVAEIDSDSFFNWEVRPKEAATTVQTKTQTQTEPAVVRIEKAPADSVRLALKQPEATAEKPATHQVKQGETLYAIAKQYNVGVTDLLEWNSLEIASGIKPGQVLAVKPTQAKESVPQTPQSQFIVHEVKESDTLYSVARQYNVTIKDIMEWNKKEDFKVSRGEKLRILTQ
ncbi:MAG TPA: hypothetical protein DHV26_01985, partial [Cytophagales bacterium]|nr:hypothetical protein [Cytophagales bacterium]